MKKRTTELINKALGEESAGKPNRIKKVFTTGKDILQECEKLEHLIEEEGEEVFLTRVRKLVNRKEKNEPT